MSYRTETLLNALLDGLPESAWLTIDRYLGRLRPGPNWHLERQLENHFCYVIVGGSGDLRCGGDVLQIQAPSMVLLSAKTTYSIRTNPEAPLIFYPVHFHKQGRQSTVDLPPAWQLINTTPWPDISSTMDSLFSLWSSRTSQGRQGAAAGLHALLARCAVSPEDVSGSTEERRIQKVCRFIDRHPADRMPLTELAKMTGMSRSRFFQQFKKVTGQTPLNYIIQKRCTYAAGLIRNEGFRIGEAATAAGYSDPFSFSKQFHSHMGYPPSKLRESI